MKSHGHGPRNQREARNRRQVADRRERTERRRHHEDRSATPHEFEPLRGPDDPVCSRCFEVHS